jgi:lipopolysaccharide export system protein LptA
MAVSHPDQTIAARLGAACAAACVAAAIGCPAFAPTASADQPPDTQLPISLDAQSSDLDYRNNIIVFRKVKITQGKMSVEADQAQANGVNFDNSRWNFRGKVRISVDQGLLTSDEAEITFSNKVLTRAIINGTPAEFEQPREKAGLVARGRANLIIYDVQQGTVNLSKDAWLTDGQNEIRGESLKYSVREQRVIADAAEQGSHRVHILITPPPAKSKP